MILNQDQWRWTSAQWSIPRRSKVCSTQPFYLCLSFALALRGEIPKSPPTEYLRTLGGTSCCTQEITCHQQHFSKVWDIRVLASRKQIVTYRVQHQIFVVIGNMSMIFHDTKDPLPVVHRPLMVYAGTSLLCPMVSYKAVLVVFQLESKQKISKWLERLIVICHCDFSTAAFACPYVFLLLGCCTCRWCNGSLDIQNAVTEVPWVVDYGREGCDRGKHSSLLIRLGPGIS